MRIVIVVALAVGGCASLDAVEWRGEQTCSREPYGLTLYGERWGGREFEGWMQIERPTDRDETAEAAIVVPVDEGQTGSVDASLCLNDLGERVGCFDVDTFVLADDLTFTGTVEDERFGDGGPCDFELAWTGEEGATLRQLR